MASLAPLALVLCLAACSTKYEVVVSSHAERTVIVHLRMSDGSGDWTVEATPHSRTSLRVLSQTDAHLEVELIDASKVLDRQNVGYFQRHASAPRPTCIAVTEADNLAIGCTSAP